MDGAFKTPYPETSPERPPYFHEGHALTLEEAVDSVLKGGTKNPNPMKS